MAKKKTFWTTKQAYKSRRTNAYFKMLDEEEAKEKKKTRLRSIATAAAVVAAATGVYAAASSHFGPLLDVETTVETTPAQISQPRRADDCDSSGYRTRATAVAIDMSDPVSQSVLDRLYTLVTDDIVQEERGTTIVLSGIDDEDVHEPLINLHRTCNPGTPSDRDVFHTSPGEAARDFAVFQAGVERALSGLFTPDQKSASPICEAIVSLMRQPELRNASSKSLRVASDFLQFVPGKVTSYGHSPNFLNAWPTQCQIDLSGVDIVLYVINRQSPSQTPALIEYWQSNLRALGAASVRVVDI
ncbi:hypothetical protein [uncultured Litoreibacter sp.]|uniref:hypothetical protein n=1 Tax=uncultured Litoreibacter sp. TaxID=1392394 RepID=UPI0026346FC8|nr:hypothetical protein [uncultured Litoreibacter sp.]